MDLKLLVIDFGLYSKSAAEQRGQELQVPTVSGVVELKPLVIIFGFYSKNAAERRG